MAERTVVAVTRASIAGEYAPAVEHVQRRRRWPMTALMVLRSCAAVALALVTTAWFLLVLPFALPAAFGAWLGLSDEELLDALDGGGEADLGRGPAGWVP